MEPEREVAQALKVDHSLQRAKRHKRSFIIGGITLVTLIIVIFWLRSAKNAKALKFETKSAERGNLTVTVTATGTLEPTNQVEVGSELSGIVETVDVDYNDEVKVGQVLAMLDTEKLEAQVIKSKAALESAQASVLQAQASVLETRNELDRLRQLWEKTERKAPSQHDLDAAEAAYERAKATEAIAKAQVSEARATLNANETDLSKTAIRSPIDGIVLTREVEPGQTVAASLQAPVLFTLAEDLAEMELHVAVDEADVGEVKEGQEALFTVDAYPNKSFYGTVTQVRFGSQTVEGVVTYETVLNVDNSDLLLRPGMTATAEITIKKIEDALLVPTAALHFSPPEQMTQSSSEGGSVVRRLLPFPPRRSSREQNRNGKNSQVWTLKAGVVAPISLTLGATDGKMTEVLAGDITPGVELIVGTEGPST